MTRGCEATFSENRKPKSLLNANRRFVSCWLYRVIRQAGVGLFSSSGNRIPSRETRSATERALDSASVPRTANQVKSLPMIPHRILIYKVFPASEQTMRPHGLWLSESVLYLRQVNPVQCVGSSATRMSLWVVECTGYGQTSADTSSSARPRSRSQLPVASRRRFRRRPPVPVLLREQSRGSGTLLPDSCHRCPRTCYIRPRSGGGTSGEFQRERIFQTWRRGSDEAETEDPGRLGPDADSRRVEGKRGFASTPRSCSMEFTGLSYFFSRVVVTHFGAKCLAFVFIRCSGNPARVWDCEGGRGDRRSVTDRGISGSRVTPCNYNVMTQLHGCSLVYVLFKTAYVNKSVLLRRRSVVCEPLAFGFPNQSRCYCG